MNKIKMLVSMTIYELKLLLRSRWLLNFTILFLVMAGLFYFYGLKSVDTNPAEVKFGLESIGEVDTGNVDPSYFGLEEIQTDANKTAAENESAGYNRAIAMLMNLSLWIVPIICLILGANAIIADKESGRMSLYKTYQMPYMYYLLSKFIALCISLITFLSVSYSIFGIVLAIAGKAIEANYLQIFLLLNVFLVIVFSALSLIVGSVSVTRIQGLSLALFVWSFFVFVYEFIIFSIIDWVPFTQKLNSILVMILLNPIESVRVWTIEKLNADYVFGPEFLILNEWGQKGLLTIYILLSFLLMIIISLFLSNQLIKRRG